GLGGVTGQEGVGKGGRCRERYIGRKPDSLQYLPPSSCSIDESYKYIFLPLCYSFTFVFSITLNSIVLWLSLRRTNYVMRDRWVFGDFLCRLVRILFYFNLYCSIFFLTCISVHRNLGICPPMRTITLETKRAVKGTCVLMWGVVFALTCQIFRFAPNGTGEVETYQNCWDDAIDKEFQDYHPFWIILHLLGFFLLFSIIAWCYLQMVLTIFLTLQGMLIVLGTHSPYAHRHHKSIKTIITITLLFALCFFPFHVTRTIFFILKVTKGIPCHSMAIVSMCYKIMRSLATFNAWLIALLYFFTKEKGGGAPYCPQPDTTATAVNQQHRLLRPQRKLRRVGEEEGGVVNYKGNNKETNKTPVHLFKDQNQSQIYCGISSIDFIHPEGINAGVVV
uniref:Si:dkey-6n21.13 n=1 Tax=Salmo trutta TaxID=8032 RepID=A0A673Y7M8_SALTR